VILQTPKVMSVIGGDFSSHRRDESAKTAAFCTEVVMQLPDAILTIENGSMVIRSQNIAAQRLFGPIPAETPIAKFFGAQWTGAVANLLAVTSDHRGVTESLVFQIDD
jgi:hypothetical protein